MVVMCCVLGACHNDYTPKPQAYIRIDMPAHKYARLDTLPGNFEGIRVPGVVLPFTFEINDGVGVALKKNNQREVWVDLNYPEWDGVVFLSYKRLGSMEDLRGQTDTSLRLMESHYQFASGVEEDHFESTEHQVYGTTYRLHGSRVASTYQFWVTDSAHHFLRGARYLNRTPNNDSLAPVLEYIQADLDHLVETLHWR